MSTTAHDHHHDDDENRANVVHLPVRRADTTPDATPDKDGLEPEGAVVGELLTEEQSAELDRRMAAARVREAAGAVVRVVRTGATHERTRSVARAVRRNAGYAVAGARIRREERRARRKHLDLEQAITTLRVNAKSAEDFHVLKELEEVLERRRSGSAQRGRERRLELLRWSGGAVVLLAGGHVVFLGVSAAQTVVGAASLTDRWNDMVEFWSTVAELSPVGGYWWAWALVGAGTWVARTVPVGRDRGALPVWADDAGAAVPADGRDIVVDESAVLSALRYLGGLPLLKQAFKQGWGSSITPTWLQLPHKDGHGVRMQLVLPRGVPVEEIVKRKTTFAHNLSRLPVEVWPSEPKDRAGVLDLWVADPGALSGPVGPWPLLAGDGPTDFFASIPVGVNIRGEVVHALLFEKNYAAAGMMGSGKSSLFITLVAGVILDPLVEVDVFVLAENADYEPMAPRLRTLRTGADRDTMTACLDTLRALYDELGERGKALREHNVRKVDRKTATKDHRLRPRVVVIDECQALFMDEEYGETAADLVTKLISAARKYGIVLMFATPEASTASLPRKIMAVTSCKACFAIGDQQSNDAILGTGSYKAGISAVSLDPKTDESDGDVGTAMVRGIMAKPGLLRSFYLTPAELAEVTDRAMDLRAGHAPAPTGDDGTPDEVDFLADLAHVVGTDKRVRTAVVLSRLVEHRPDHYGEWTFKTLRPALDQAGVPVRKSDGDSVVRADDITEALTLREHYDGDDTAE
ncbi:FtsK/SpoIIIE domain-containing protein [Actinosynnema sp. NPDC059797]